MGRQVRSDITVGSLEKKLGVKPGRSKTQMAVTLGPTRSLERFARSRRVG